MPNNPASLVFPRMRLRGASAISTTLVLYYRASVQITRWKRERALFSAYAGVSRTALLQVICTYSRSACTCTLTASIGHVMSCSVHRVVIDEWIPRLA